MKKILFFATAFVALAACTDDAFIGDQNLNIANERGGTDEIVFGSGLKRLTRADDHVGADAAEKLNNEFVFAGTKLDKESTPVTHLVFDQYYAKWAANTANTTESNSNDWEYVSYTPYGVGNSSISTLPSGATQSIKYWDYNTTQYDFAAYSLGKGSGSTPTYATASKIDKDTKSYTLTGTADELKACYISDLVTAYNRDNVSDYGKVVDFKFRSLGTKVRLAFYETVPGYSVKDVNFYTVASGSTASTTPALFTSSAVLPSGSGTMTITFPTVGFDNSPYGSSADTDYNKAHVSFAQESGVAAASTVTFDALANFPTTYEGKLTTGNFLGRASNDATYAGGTTGSPAAGKFYTVLPYETGANLQLRIKYTLVSTDGSGEEITVDNATAVIPAELAKWNPNYAYTYIFKISDMTNGTTGVDGDGNPVYGLTPITLTAVVVDSEDGVQETITTVSDPSITTYTKGKVVTTGDEYITNANIYVIVNNGTSNVAYSASTFKLYTVTLAASTDVGDSPAATAAQTISEESVANALANGTKDDNDNPTTWTVKDANQWKLVVTKSNLLSAITSIPATDSPTGNAITVNGSVFKPTTAATFVFQYDKAAVAAADPVYTKYNENDVIAEGTKYYVTAGIYTEQTADSNITVTADDDYYKLTTPAVVAEPAVNQFKLIKVRSAE